MIEKRSKNLIAWIRRDEVNERYTKEVERVQEELSALVVEETRLDEEISLLQETLRETTTSENGEHSAFAYVTHEDINSVPELQNDTLIAIKAPPGTELKVPDIDDEEDEIHAEKKYVFLPTIYPLNPTSSLFLFLPLFPPAE